MGIRAQKLCGAAIILIEFACWNKIPIDNIYTCPAGRAIGAGSIIGETLKFME
jgi:hypothetical protein